MVPKELRIVQDREAVPRKGQLEGSPPWEAGVQTLLETVQLQPIMIGKFAELPGLELVHSSWGSKKPPSQVCGVLMGTKVTPGPGWLRDWTLNAWLGQGPSGGGPLHTTRQGPEEKVRQPQEPGGELPSVPLLSKPNNMCSV